MSSGRSTPSPTPPAPHVPPSWDPVTDVFDYPLKPAHAYGAYAQGITGFRGIDTRFGVQNPAMGNRSNCFRDRQGNRVPFSQLYHAGVDLFALGRGNRFLWSAAAGNPVRAVADGVTVSTRDTGAQGQVIITKHQLADGSLVYSLYWHVADLRVKPGQGVHRGEVIATVHDQGRNSHLHWEMRTFLDGSRLFPAGSAGARGTCNGQLSGVGYTWDDDTERARPEFYGYLDPMAFVARHGGQRDDIAQRL